MADEVERVTAYLPVSQELIDDYSIDPDLLAAALRGDLPAREPKPPPPTPAGHAALLQATAGALREVVELHAPVWAYMWECQGCDADGYEWEPPSWPCSTVELIAQRVGVELGEDDDG